MRHFLYSYQTNVTFSSPIYNHSFKLRCRPYINVHQQIADEHFTISPNCWVTDGTDAFGNRTIVGGYYQHHFSFGYISSGIVSQKEVELKRVETNLPLYLFPTSLTMPTSELNGLDVPAGNVFDKAEFIAHWVHDFLEYTPGITHSSSTVSDVMQVRKGVCQDFSHVMLAACRLNKIPARYVCGMMLGEGETHAWVEVSDGKIWKAYDPTNDNFAEYGYVKLSQGRDARDCSVCNGMFVGNVVQKTDVTVSVFEV